MLRLISGGQTGVDRAALDVALELGLPCGGWCPRGRRAEDGPIPARYPLQELDSDTYPPRIERNVLESDGTLVVTRGPLRAGTRLTVDLALRHGRPCLVVDLREPAPPQEAREWLATLRIRCLNVAGPRESSQPGIGAAARHYLRALLAQT